MGTNEQRTAGRKSQNPVNFQASTTAVILQEIKMTMKYVYISKYKKYIYIFYDVDNLWRYTYPVEHGDFPLPCFYQTGTFLAKTGWTETMVCTHEPRSPVSRFYQYKIISKSHVICDIIIREFSKTYPAPPTGTFHHFPSKSKLFVAFFRENIIPIISLPLSEASMITREQLGGFRLPIQANDPCRKPAACSELGGFGTGKAYRLMVQKSGDQTTVWMYKTWQIMGKAAFRSLANSMLDEFWL